MMLLEALVDSVLLYGAEVWGCCRQTDRLLQCLWWHSEVCYCHKSCSACHCVPHSLRHKHIPYIATTVAYILWSLFYRMLLHTRLLQCVLSNTHECTHDILVLYR